MHTEVAEVVVHTEVAEVVVRQPGKQGVAEVASAYEVQQEYSRRASYWLLTMKQS